jgi:hypothetical protein
VLDEGDVERRSCEQARANDREQLEQHGTPPGGVPST